jgi:hypothetical protein
VPAVLSGSRLFVAGHDPERDGRLVYRGRVGRAVPVHQTGAALRLATANALASAGAAVGSLNRLRCVVLTAFVSTPTAEGVAPEHLDGSLALLAATLAPGEPAVWLRSAQGLAGGMPVEVELLLETRPRRARRPLPVSPRARRSRTGGSGGDRAPRRSGGRTS